MVSMTSQGTPELVSTWVVFADGREYPVDARSAYQAETNARLELSRHGIDPPAVKRIVLDSNGKPSRKRAFV